MKKRASYQSLSKQNPNSQEPKPQMSRSERLRLQAFKNVQDGKQLENKSQTSKNEREVLHAVEDVDEKIGKKILEEHNKEARRFELIQEALNMGWLPNHSIDFDCYEYSESVLVQMEEASANYRVAVYNNRLDPRINYSLIRLLLLGFGAYFVYVGYTDLVSREWLKVSIDIFVLLFTGVCIMIFSESIKLVKPDINLSGNYTKKNKL